jgi:wyosine [tRNA(Phe)-imidazoG37] synthetase (radical SAM superfamily)
MLLELQPSIVYGPVHSRRLGRSLGVNILPLNAKLCTFNCLYCQYGWTGIHGTGVADGVALPSTAEILEAVKKALQMIDPPPAYITFSGNGEPTLHPDFPAIVDGIIELRDEFSPDSKTAILSNSTTVGDERVRRALSKLDVRIMKLDCGTEEMMLRYNQQCSGIRFEEIVEGLASLEDITIQALFSGGPKGNASDEAIAVWVSAVERISPAKVQIYTLDRDFPSRQISPLTKVQLLDISAKLESKGIRAGVF